VGEVKAMGASRLSAQDGAHAGDDTPQRIGLDALLAVAQDPRPVGSLFDDLDQQP
jgi:hypothetical protein